MDVSVASQGFANVDLALYANRALVGLFFLFSGYHKLFNKARHAGLVATLKECKVPLIGINQWFVPAVEFVGGGALIVGLFAPVAAALLLVICGVAFVTDGIKRVVAYAPIDAADYCDDVLYIPEVLYGISLMIVIIAGPGHLLSIL